MSYKEVKVIGEFIVLPDGLAIKKGSLNELRVLSLKGTHYLIIATTCIENLDEILSKRPPRKPIKRFLRSFGISALGPFPCKEVALEAEEEFLNLLQSDASPEFLNAILEDCTGKDLQKCAEAAESAEKCLERKRKFSKNVKKKTGANTPDTPKATTAADTDDFIYPGKYRVDKDKARRYFLPLMQINAPAAIVTVESIKRVPDNPDEVVVHVKAEYGNLKTKKKFILSLNTLKERGILKEG